jgi:molecular chaperone Hsp33
VTSTGDTLRRFVFERFPVRGHLVRLDAAWRALIEHHAYPRSVEDALGQTTAATALLAASVKFDGRLTLQLQGPGPMHLLVVQASPGLALRGVARHSSEVPAEATPLSGLTGGGQLTVTIESDDAAARYQGIVPLDADTLSECFQHYFAQSEQLPTRLWLAASADCAAGLLLQRLPGAEASAEADEDWNRILHLATTLTSTELTTLSSDVILRRLFHEEDVRVFDPSPVYFRCTCSRERVDGILRSLGADEVRSILTEQGRVEVKCEFCNRAYGYDAVDAGALFGPSGLPPRAPLQ